MAAIDNPAEWIVLLFNKHARESDHWDCEIFPEGAVIPKLPMADSELVYGVYKDKYYFSPAALYVMDDKGCRRIHWRSIIKCSSFHGCGKANSRLKLIDGTTENVRLSDLETGWSGRIGQLYHQMIERHGSIDAAKYTPVPEHLAHIARTQRGKKKTDLHAPEWNGTVLCSCGAEDRFELHFIGLLSPERFICDTDDVIQSSWLECLDCEREQELFDPTKHGYDASNGDAPKRPAKQTQVKQILSCTCGAKSFRVSASAIFDYEGIELIDEGSVSNAFGWFNVEVECSVCSRQVEVIGYETA